MTSFILQLDLLNFSSVLQQVVQRRVECVRAWVTDEYVHMKSCANNVPTQLNTLPQTETDTHTHTHTHTTPPLHPHRHKTLPPMLTTIVSLVAAAASARAEDAPQGVLLFMPDDMPFFWPESPPDPAAAGGTSTGKKKKKVYTDWRDYDALLPNMNRIRSEGVTFLQSYTSSPKCAPSRFGLMTGRYPSRALFSRTHDRQLSAADQSRTFVSVPSTKLDATDKARTLAATLRGTGTVSTVMAGKWHLEGDDGGIDLFAEYSASAAAVEAAGFERPAAVYIENMDSSGRADFSHNNEWTVAESAAAIKLSVQAGKDFFVYCAPTGPHSPLNEAALDDFGLTDTPNGTQMSSLSSGMKSRDSVKSRVSAAVGSSSPNRDTLIGVVGVDDSLGALLASLEAEKVLSNTLVIVTMDHGQIAKDSVYEGGTRTVLMMRLPGVFAPGSAVAAPVTNLDLVPTILEFQGLLGSSAYELDGVSLFHAAANANAAGDGDVGTSLGSRQCIVSEIDQLRAAVCGGRYKYVSKLATAAGGDSMYPASAAIEQLYDLATDPLEQTNLADRGDFPDYAAITAEIRAYVACHDLDTSPGGATSCDTSVLRPLAVVGSSGDDDDDGEEEDEEDAETPATTTTTTTITTSTSTTTTTTTTTAPPSPTSTVALPPSSAAKSCAELGWTNIVDGVCGESDDGLGVGGSKQCSSDETYAAAVEICSAAGARICTADEVGTGVTESTGCRFNSKLVWTSTSCGNGKVYKSRGKGNGVSKCVAETKTAAVQCCADVSSPLARRASSSDSSTAAAEAGAASAGSKPAAVAGVVVGCVAVAVALVGVAIKIRKNPLSKNTASRSPVEELA